MTAENERLKIEAERSVLLDMSKRVTNIPERTAQIGSEANDKKLTNYIEAHGLNRDYY